MLTEFNVISENPNSKDFYERAGDFFLKPLRLACGRCVKINIEKEYAQERVVDRTYKIAIFILLSLAFPITLFTTLAGLVLIKYSDSYAKMNQIYAEMEFTIPKRRLPPIGACDTFVWRHGRETYAKGEGCFIKDEEIEKIHPIKYLSNPFQNWRCKEEQVDQAVGVTKLGKHVILQQGNRACVPTAIAMLILDRGGRPNYEAIETTNLANDEQALDWVSEAGFKPKITFLEKENVLEQLIKLLKENGPGKLGIDSDIGFHAIVLDAISLEDKTVDIRDPSHGWMITIKLDTFLALPPSSFIQIEQSILPSFVIKLQFLFNKILQKNHQLQGLPHIP